jgi:hypothetical protein
MARAERRIGPLSGRRRGRVGWVDRSLNRCHGRHPMRRSAIFDSSAPPSLIGLACSLVLVDRRFGNWPTAERRHRRTFRLFRGDERDRQRRSPQGWSSPQQSGGEFASAFSTTRACHARVPKRVATEIQLSSCSGPQPFQPGASSRRPRKLQTETLGRAGRMVQSDGLILTWNSVSPRLTDAECNQSRFCPTRPSGGHASCASSQRAGDRHSRDRSSSRSKMNSFGNRSKKRSNSSSWRCASSVPASRPTAMRS